MSDYTGGLMPGNAEPANTEPGNIDPGSRASRWPLFVAAGAVPLTVLGVLGSAFVVDQRDALADRDHLRAEYVRAAELAITNITNINADTARADIQRVLEVTSGDLQREYSDRMDDYTSTVQKAQVRTTGTVVATAPQSSDEHSAVVLVVVEQTLSYSGVEGPQHRQLRFKVSLDRDDDTGGITATGMETVV
ncbi:hypothetical protein [Nocardia jejuensis]|uniref:hypothetical protein n=1 Tax=Nocardia jejuensis TaxID=328049 RepID=UPI000A48F4D9|nr:hypothetical protein [Nocardia jejuensis]